MKRFLQSEPLLSKDGRKMSEGIDFLIRVHVSEFGEMSAPKLCGCSILNPARFVLLSRPSLKLLRC